MTSVSVMLNIPYFVCNVIRGVNNYNSDDDCKGDVDKDVDVIVDCGDKENVQAVTKNLEMNNQRMSKKEEPSVEEEKIRGGKERSRRSCVGEERRREEKQAH